MSEGELGCGEKLKESESGADRDSGLLRETAANVKYFTNFLSVKHFTLICLGCIV